MSESSQPATTLFEKVWQRHLVREESAQAPAILYIDLQLLHEVTSPQAFDELKRRGLKVRRPDRCLATIDHSTPTTPPDNDGVYHYHAAEDQAPNTMPCLSGVSVRQSFRYY